MKRRNLHGTMVTVVFVKKDGTLRKANGNLMAPIRENQQFITIRETLVTRKDHIFTTIPLDAIISFKGGKQEC